MSIAIKGTDANPLTTRDVDASSINVVRVYGRLVFSGTYTDQADGGDTVDFTTVSDKLEGSTLLFVEIFNNSSSANRYVFKRGTTLANSSLTIYDSTNTELATGAAYPADTVFFEAIIRKLG